MSALELEMEGYCTESGLSSLHQDMHKVALQSPPWPEVVEGRYIILELIAATFSFRIFETKQPHICYVH